MIDPKSLTIGLLIMLAIALLQCRVRKKTFVDYRFKKDSKRAKLMGRLGGLMKGYNARKNNRGK